MLKSRITVTMINIRRIVRTEDVGRIEEDALDSIEARDTEEGIHTVEVNEEGSNDSNRRSAISVINQAAG
jgi:hypothetical protein